MNQVAYIRQGKILHMREWDTGKMVFSTPGSSTGVQSRPQSHIVMNLISRAFDINIMHWVGTLPTSDETIEVNGRTYSRVGDARFPTYADYEDYIRGTFIGSEAGEYLALGPYVNVDGKIFVASGDRGAGYLVDLYRMVVLESRSNYVKVELHIPSKWDDEDDQTTVVEFARQQDGRWLILSGNIGV